MLRVFGAGCALGLVLVTSAVSARSPQAFSKRPVPATARRAIAFVRAHPDTSREASPYLRELGWVAEWRGDRWWLVGLFESPWHKRFVVDASIIRGRVQTYTNYAGRPSGKWVRATARRWKLATLYTRLTPAAAIELTRESVSLELRPYTVLDAAAKLARDNARLRGWYFAYYVRAEDGKNRIMVVTGLGDRPSEEGNYVSGYGFGSQSEVHETVPLYLSDWVGGIAKARGWRPSTL
jgi:hypothetical protein